MRRGVTLILAVLAVCFIPAYAQGPAPAEELTVRISVTGGKASVLTDGRENSYTAIP